MFNHNLANVKQIYPCQSARINSNNYQVINYLTTYL